MTIGEKLTSIPRWVLYLALIVSVGIMLFIPIDVPNKPQEAAIDFYGKMMEIPEGSSIIVGSDWTKSTHGESGAHFTVLLKLAMMRDLKILFYSTADPQAMQVARDAITAFQMDPAYKKIEEFRTSKGWGKWEPYSHWVVGGYFPNSDNTNAAMADDLSKTFAGRKDGGKDIWSSPVMKGITKIGDFKMLVLITASSTAEVTVSTIGKTKMPMSFMVTGVMVPQTTSYYSSGQLVGMAGGLKGAYDLESLIELGINHEGKERVDSPKFGDIPPLGIPGKGQAAKYISTLHAALTLMILAVILGNIGMFLNKAKKEAA